VVRFNRSSASALGLSVGRSGRASIGKIVSRSFTMASSGTLPIKHIALVKSPRPNASYAFSARILGNPLASLSSTASMMMAVSQ